MYNIEWQTIKGIIALFLTVVIVFLFCFLKKDRKIKADFIVNNMVYNRICIDNKEFIQGGKVKLVEPPTGTKDKYVTSAMGNLFIQELEADLTKKDNNKIDISSLFRFNLQKIR